jgi:uncharacterized peroxidase-related enzyme
MTRIPAVDPARTEGKTRDQLTAVNRMLGATPNLFRVAAQAPAVLDGLVGLIGALSRGGLGGSTREAIALAVAQTNGCDYCLSAHTVLGAGAGLSPGGIAAARGATATATDPRLAAILRFARAIVDRRGQITDDQLADLRRAGGSDADALEVVANVALNILTNYLNLVAATEIDFPVVTAASRAAMTQVPGCTPSPR